MLKDVFIVGGARTPFGSFHGALAEVPAPQLGSTAIKGALSMSGVAADCVDEVVMGNVLGAGLGQNPARQAAVGAGIPLSTPASVVNKVCGSAERAIRNAAQAIQCGDAGLVVAGGLESMTRAPYMLFKVRGGCRLGNSELVDAILHDGLLDAYSGKHMGLCGEQCVAKFGFTREEQDQFSIESYKRAIAARSAGYFKNEIAPVEIRTRKGAFVVDMDEEPSRFDESRIRGLRPVFDPQGTITAGNASPISDGAAAVVLASAERVKALGLKPRARILGYATHSMEPERFTEAPIYAVRKLCERVSLKLGAIDLFEINEAFACVAMAAMRELPIPHEKLNVLGGAVALGHPIGATGARLVLTLINALKIRGGRVGIACACIGGGEAGAIAIELV